MSLIKSTSSINKIGLGTVQFGVDYGISNASGKTAEEEVRRILEFASANHIETVDTASAYGDAEEVLGRSDVSNFAVVSKFLPGAIRPQLLASLDKLQIPSLYGYIAHRPMSIVENPHGWEELEIYKREGKVKKIGFSFNDLDEMEQVLEAGFTPDLIQVPFNYFDRRFIPSVQELKRNGCEIHTRSTFLQGLFFCNPIELGDHFDDVKPILSELRTHGDALPALLLKWVIETEFVDKVVVGVNNLVQLKGNINSLLSVDGELGSLKQIISDDILMPSRWPKK